MFPVTKLFVLLTLQCSDCRTGEVQSMMKHSTAKQFPSEVISNHKMHKSMKSFSHELGPKGGIPSVQPRARSFSDLKVQVTAEYKLLKISCRM